MNARRRLRFSPWLLLSLLLCCSTWAGAVPLDVAQPSEQPLSLTTHAGMLEDASRALQLSDVRSAKMAAHFRYQESPSASFALGFTRSAYWFRLELGNAGDQPLTRLLVVDNPRISLVDAYVPDGQGGLSCLVHRRGSPAERQGL